MSKLSVLLLLNLAFIGPLSALSEQGKAAVGELAKSLATEMASKTEGISDVVKKRSHETILRQLDSITSGVGGLPTVTFDEGIEPLLRAFKSREVEVAAAKLRLELLNELETSEASKNQKLNNLLTKSADIFSTAKDPADLDAVISELGNAYNEEQSHSSQGRPDLLSQVQKMNWFLCEYQEYLMEMKLGGRGKARDKISSMRNSQSVPTSIPRSRVLELLASVNLNPNKSSDIINSIKTLSDMSDALQQLRDAGSNNESNMNYFVSNLTRLDQIYHDFIGGLPVSIPRAVTSEGMSKVGTEKYVAMKSALYKLILPRYLQLPEGTLANELESVSQFLDRIEADAKKNDEIVTVVRIRQARQVFSGNNETNQDQNLISSYLAARSQEAANQIESAVLQYQQLLKNGSDLVPAKTIGARLAELEISHPEAYAKAMERYYNPPFPQHPHMRMSGMSGRGAYYGHGEMQPTQNETRPVEKLDVPAAKETTKASPPIGDPKVKKKSADSIDKK